MKKLRKSATDRKIWGVCAGLAEYMNIDPTIVRLIAVIIALCSCGTAALIYLVAGIVMPD